MTKGSPSKTKKIKVFNRDKICQICGIELHFPKKSEISHNTRRMRIHHIRPKSEGGTDGLYNLEARCCVCERRHHNIETKGERDRNKQPAI